MTSAHITETGSKPIITLGDAFDPGIIVALDGTAIPYPENLKPDKILQGILYAEVPSPESNRALPNAFLTLTQEDFHLQGFSGKMNFFRRYLDKMIPPRAIFSEETGEFLSEESYLDILLGDKTALVHAFITAFYLDSTGDLTPSDENERVVQRSDLLDHYNLLLCFNMLVGIGAVGIEEALDFVEAFKDNFVTGRGAGTREMKALDTYLKLHQVMVRVTQVSDLPTTDIESSLTLDSANKAIEYANRFIQRYSNLPDPQKYYGMMDELAFTSLRGLIKSRDRLLKQINDPNL